MVTGYAQRPGTMIPATEGCQVASKGVEAGYPLPQGTAPVLNRPVSPDLQSSRGRPSPAWHLGPSGLKIPPLEAFDAESAPLLATPMEVDLVRTKCHPQATVALDM